MRARKTDQNAKAIYDLARKVGFLVNIRNDTLGDLDVQYRGRHEVWECKSYELGKKGKPLKARFTDLQLKHMKEGWIIWTVRTAEDVMSSLARFK